MMRDSKSVIGLNMLALRDAKGLGDYIQPLTELMEQGVIDPVVAEAFPVERAADAHRYLSERKNIGKVVLTSAEELDQALRRSTSQASRQTSRSPRRDPVEPHEDDRVAVEVRRREEDLRVVGEQRLLGDLVLDAGRRGSGPSGAASPSASRSGCGAAAAPRRTACPSPSTGAGPRTLVLRDLRHRDREPPDIVPAWPRRVP